MPRPLAIRGADGTDLAGFWRFIPGKVDPDLLRDHWIVIRWSEGDLAEVYIVADVASFNAWLRQQHPDDPTLWTRGDWNALNAPWTH